MNEKMVKAASPETELRQKKAFENFNSVLDENSLQTIIREIESGVSLKDIAKHVNVNYNTFRLHASYYKNRMNANEKQKYRIKIGLVKIHSRPPPKPRIDLIYWLTLQNGGGKLTTPSGRYHSYIETIKHPRWKQSINEKWDRTVISVGGLLSFPQIRSFQVILYYLDDNLDERFISTSLSQMNPGYNSVNERGERVPKTFAGIKRLLDNAIASVVSLRDNYANESFYQFTLYEVLWKPY